MMQAMPTPAAAIPPVPAPPVAAPSRLPATEGATGVPGAPLPMYAPATAAGGVAPVRYDQPGCPATVGRATPRIRTMPRDLSQTILAHGLALHGSLLSLSAGSVGLAQGQPAMGRRLVVVGLQRQAELLLVAVTPGSFRNSRTARPPSEFLRQGEDIASPVLNYSARGFFNWPLGRVWSSADEDPPQLRSGAAADRHCRSLFR